MTRFSFVLFFFLSFTLYSKNKELIAVLPFSGQGLETNESFIITESLIKDLSKSDKYDLMELPVLEKKLKSEGVHNINACDNLACALVYGEFLSLKYLIQGRLSKIENTYTFNMRFIDIKNGVILSDFTEFFTGDTEGVLKKVVPKLSKKIHKVNISQWRVEKNTPKKMEEAQVETEKTKIQNLSTKDSSIENTKNTKNTNIEKTAAEELTLPISPVSTSTTLAPKIEFEKEISEADLSLSVPEETPDKKRGRRNKKMRDKEVDKPSSEAKDVSVSPVSTSTTLAPKIEFEKEISEADLSVSPPEETPDKKRERRNRRKRDKEEEKSVSEELALSVSPESTALELSLPLEKEEKVDVINSTDSELDKTESKSPENIFGDSDEKDTSSEAASSLSLTTPASEDIDPISKPDEIKKDAQIDPVLTQLNDDITDAEEKEDAASASETPSEIPFTKSVGEIDGESREVEQNTLSADENSEKDTIKTRRRSRRRERKTKSDFSDITVVTAPDNSEFLQKDSNPIYIDDETETFSDVQDNNPSITKDSEIETDKPVISTEETLLSDTALIADADNNNSMHIDSLQEGEADRKKKAIPIIASSIGAAVALPVFIILFSKKEEKEPDTFSLTVEWP